MIALKNDEKCFYFKSFFRSQYILIFVLTFGHVEKTGLSER